MTQTAAEFAPQPGAVLALRDDLALVLAPNPSAMTGPGTNTYLLGHDRIVVIDPGPAIPAHLDAVLQAIGGRVVDHILVTHSHLDHSALAPALAAATGAAICGFGGPAAGRSAVMSTLTARGLTGGGEGIDPDFAPDRTLADGDGLQGDWGRITAIHTPGHIGNHLCFAWGDVLFSGDHVMGWASSLVSPPDGDLTDFMASCLKLQGVPATCFHPGHGAPVLDPQARLAWLIGHRLQREAQILAALAAGPATARDVTAFVYKDLSPLLAKAAERNVLAHLIDLHGKSIVAATPGICEGAVFHLHPGGLPPVTGI
jgi:glyoxylase-like metal-dependent hydrolase (beta-lactamase superfamily II)